MAESAGKRDRRPPDVYAPTQLKAPSRYVPEALGRAEASRRSNARSQEAVESARAAQDSFLTSNGFEKVVFQNVGLPAGAAYAYYLREGLSLLTEHDIQECANAAERLIPQSSFAEGGKAHKHIKFPSLQATPDGRRILNAVRGAMMHVWEVGCRATEAELVARSGASADTPHRLGWENLTIDAHQDAQTGHVSFDRGGTRWLFDLAPGEGRQFQFLRVHDGKVEVLLSVQARVVVMSAGAAGAGRIGWVWHRRWQQGASLSLDVALPNHAKDSVAARFSDLPAYSYFLPSRVPATAETVAAQVGARRGDPQKPTSQQKAEQRAATAKPAAATATSPHCFVCLFPEAGEQRKLFNCEGLLLCRICNLAGVLQHYPAAADRPAAKVGHPEFGCPGCMPGARTAAPGGIAKRQKRSATGKQDAADARLREARKKAATVAAAIVQAAANAASG